MKIQDGSKKILDYLVKKVIKHGSLMDSFFIDCDQLTNDLGLESKQYCIVCCHYLHQLDYIKIIRKDESGARLIELTAKGIDFLETT